MNRNGRTVLGKRTLIFVFLAGFFVPVFSCRPLDLFYQIDASKQQGVDFEATEDAQALGYGEEPKPLKDGEGNSPVDYVGTFHDPKYPDWQVLENYLEVSIQGTTVTGTGRLVRVDRVEFDGDPAWIDTYIMRFEGTFDPGLRAITGLVYFTGGSTCTTNCSGVQDSKYDYYQNWTATISHGDLTMDGHADGIGDYGEFSATR